MPLPLIVPPPLRLSVPAHCSTTPLRVKDPWICEPAAIASEPEIDRFAIEERLWIEDAEPRVTVPKALMVTSSDGLGTENLLQFEGFSQAMFPPMPVQKSV